MRLMAYCINALFVIAVTATSTFAGEAVSVIGVYQSAGAGMGVAIYNDPKHKIPAFAVDVLQLNQPKVRLNVGFGVEEWQQFAQIWLKAGRTAPPRQGFSTEIGSYFDRLSKTSITVSMHPAWRSQSRLPANDRRSYRTEFSRRIGNECLLHPNG